MTKKINRPRKKPTVHKAFAVNDAIFEAITKDFGSGFILEDACEKNGVSKPAYYSYLERNPKKTSLHKEALYKKEQRAYTSMDLGMVKDWKAAAWWLERTKPERFREKKEIEVVEKPKMVINGFEKMDQKNKK